METLIFVLGILCGAVLLGVAYGIRELLRVKNGIKSLNKNRYIYDDTFSSFSKEIQTISEDMKISESRLEKMIGESHDYLGSVIEEVKAKSWADSDRIYQDLHRRIDKEVSEMRSLMDSRLNKMENKFIQQDLLPYRG